MCGIAGCVVATGDGERIGREVAAMTRALAHRGPDDEGLLFWRRGSPAVAAATEHTVPPLRPALPDAGSAIAAPWQIALGHRRFSIIDITPAGHQPFVDREHRAAVVFNGEIYNFIELRAELEKEGRVFDTHSDTEVLLQSYLHWGEDMLPRLNGMWAFALLDFRTGRLMLSRDRVGEKSLFHTTVGNRLYFASEIKALLTVPEIHARRAPCDDRIRDYLFLGLRDHTYTSLFEGIVKLPPATFAWVEPGGPVRPQAYWSLPPSRLTERDLSYEDATARLTDLLGDSVGIRLRADVPLAAELSGGMDSTTMVALATRRLRAEQAQHRLRTYTVRYGDPRFDESGYARLAAEMAGAEFNTMELFSAEYWNAASSMMQTLEQPYESPNLLGNRSMWTTMKSLGIRVVLNGGAGDELLAGYVDSHLFPFLRELLETGRWATALREALAWRGTTSLTAVKARRFALHQLPGPLRHCYTRRMMMLPEFGAFPVTPEERTRLVAEAAARVCGGLSNVLARNITTAPIPMYVVQSDKLAMSIPIEIRYPFLDHRLMDFAFRLPLPYLIRNGRSKAILREAAQGLVPDAVIQRREKMGFPVPLGQWMAEGASHIRAQFESEPRSRRYINPQVALARLGQSSESMLWRMHQIELWMKVFDLS